MFAATAGVFDILIFNISEVLLDATRRGRDQITVIGVQIDPHLLEQDPELVRGPVD